ncbi:MAG: aminoacyl-tRNA hydrolase [Patescibacteria group bacterium]|nr:aminoacyl-tRNA hydrolase [Patescibacteria group bacterium]
MNIIVGLGNPDKKYEKTRHNVGFMILDRLADSSWKYSKKFKAEICHTYIEGQDVMLIKPQTYMNKSGEAVRNFVGFLNIPTDRVWVVHDDIDLNLGTIRVREGGSAGGHKGVISVINFLGTERFPRFRVGIKNEKADTMPSEKFVLQKFDKEELGMLNEVIEKTIKLIKKSLKEGIKNVST